MKINKYSTSALQGFSNSCALKANFQTKTLVFVNLNIQYSAVPFSITVLNLQLVLNNLILLAKVILLRSFQSHSQIVACIFYMYTLLVYEIKPCIKETNDHLDIESLVKKCVSKCCSHHIIVKKCVS